MIEAAEKPRVEQTRHEGWALGWLTIGLFTAWIGATIGTFLVLRSTRWTWRWKAIVLALPVVLVAALKASPVDLANWIGLTMLLVLFVGAAVFGHVALRASERGRDQSRLSPFGAVIVAVVGVAIAAGLLGKINAIDSYDLRGEAISVAQAAESAGEEVEVIQDDSEWIYGDRPNRANVEARVGPGNARFAALFEKASSRDDWDPPKLSAAELGDCYVFPVVVALDVTSTAASMESVSSLARFCYGPSSYSGTVALSDR